MLKRDNEAQLKEELQHSLDALPVPSSLLAFAKEVPSKFEANPIGMNRRTCGKRRNIAYKAAAAGVIFLLASLGAMRVSPIFAEWVKQIPGFTFTQSVLDQLFGKEGLNNAQSHGYQPFEAVIHQFDDVKISISDVYLTGDSLMFRTMMTSDNIKQHVFKREDGVSFLDRDADSYWLTAGDFNTGRRSIREAVYYDEKTKEPFLLGFHTITLPPAEVAAFIDKQPQDLSFKIEVLKSQKERRRETKTYTLQVPFNYTQWAGDRVIPLNQRIEVADDPDLKALTLEQLKITPTDTYLEVATEKGANYYLRFGGAAEESYAFDDKGKKYPLHSDDTVNLLQIGPEIENGNRLAFMSSPYFDKEVKRLTFHFAEVTLTEKMPSASFTISPGEKLPKTVSFKGKLLTITDAYYDDGYLVLKIKKNPDAPERTGIRFAVSPTVLTATDQKGGRGGINSGEARVYDTKGDHYEAHIYAPKLETYQIEMSRDSSPVRLDKDIDVELK